MHVRLRATASWPALQGVFTRSAASRMRFCFIQVKWQPILDYLPRGTSFAGREVSGMAATCGLSYYPTMRRRLKASLAEQQSAETPFTTVLIPPTVASVRHRHPRGGRALAKANSPANV